MLIHGPRGAGKTAVLRREFPGHRFVTLNDVADRAFARQDPEVFLARLRGPTIIDDLHRAPELVASLASAPPEGPLLLASSRRLRLPAITLELYPPTRAERERRPPIPLEMLGRFVPAAAASPSPSDQRHTSHDFLERDVRDLVKVHDLDRFETFYRAAEAQSGHILDQQAIAREQSLSHRTVARWLEVLDACFLTLRLPSADLDFGRRLVRSPKLHFLASASFESQAVSELYRNARHAGEVPDLRYWRDSNGFEIPLIIQSETDGLMPVGIAEAPTPTEIARLRRWMDLAGLRQAALVTNRASGARISGVLRYSLSQL